MRSSFGVRTVESSTFRVSGFRFSFKGLGLRTKVLVV